MASSKTHIQRVEKSTRDGKIMLSLCGLSHNKKQMVFPAQATCQRCIRIHADNISWKPTLSERLEDISKDRVLISEDAAENFVRGMKSIAASFNTKEVRTTSATGGQKGVKEARYSLIPAGPLRELAVLYGRGARKYDTHNWRRGYEWSKSLDAIQRHYSDFLSGKDYDVCSNDPLGCQHVDAEGNDFVGSAPDTCYNHTGAHHMVAVAWHSFVLIEFKDTHPEHDDRYLPELVDEIVFTADPIQE